MTQVRAKFKCQSITDYGTQKEAAFVAVYGKSGENADFTQATPWGELKIKISNDAPASNFFVPNEDYYLNFEKAE